MSDDLQVKGGVVGASAPAAPTALSSADADQAASRLAPHGLQSTGACRDAQRNGGIVRFRKLPVEIEAVRVNAADFNGHDWDGFPFDAAPPWLLEAITDGAIKPDTPRCTDYAEWKIETREGAVWAGPDDWIVRGVQGEIYPCGGDIFEATYAPASADTHAKRGDAAQTAAPFMSGAVASAPPTTDAQPIAPPPSNEPQHD